MEILITLTIVIAVTFIIVKRGKTNGAGNALNR